MPEKVEFAELKKPRIITVCWKESPFSEKEIEELTRGLTKYALVIDGESLYLYGE